MRKVTVARMTVIDIDVRRGNPLEVVERVASTHQWSFERAGEDELTIVVRGKMDRLSGLVHLDVSTSSRCTWLARFELKGAGTQSG